MRQPPGPSTSSRWKRRRPSRRASRPGALTGSADWQTGASRAFGWFLGRERPRAAAGRPGNRQPVATASTPIGPTRTAAASPSVSYLLSLAEHAALRACRAPRKRPHAGAIGRPLHLHTVHAAISEFRGRLVTSHVPKPAGTLSAPRSGAGRRAALQAGDRTAATLNPTDKTRANHIVDRVLGSMPRRPSGNSPTCSRISRDGTATCSRPSRRGPTRWRRPWSPHRRSARRSGGWSAPISCTNIPSRPRPCSIPASCAHPDQSRRRPAAHAAFILSLRAVGEGHVSSLTFRSGIIAADGSVDHRSDRRGSPPLLATRHRTRDLARRRRSSSSPSSRTTDISERVIFPVTGRAVERHRGRALRRLRRWRAARPTTRPIPPIAAGRSAPSCWRPTTSCRFRHDALERQRRAQQGHGAVPAQDRRPLRDDRPAGQREPLPDLFRRPHHLGRRRSRSWSPQYPWEFVQIGNCGSPIELDEGWLLLTHGVGPVRKYSIGAALLDKKDPSKVIAALARAAGPSGPSSSARAMCPTSSTPAAPSGHGERIILPYAVSDTFSNFATISIDALLGRGNGAAMT